jgi:hypothetical protein
MNAKCLARFKDKEVFTMRQIEMNQNQIVVLDDEDFESLSQYHWCYRAGQKGEQGYAIRHVNVNGKATTEYMHRAIMKPPSGYEVIFKNCDRLDCRKANLAVVTKEEARRHHKVRPDSKSGIKGVKFNPGGKTWSAFKYRDGHYHSLGAFWTKKAAIAAYERSLIDENPAFSNAPERVERRREPAADSANPDKDEGCQQQ